MTDETRTHWTLLSGGFDSFPPVLRAQDDTVRGHVANGLQLLLVEQSAESQEQRELALAGARKRFRMALELLDEEARTSALSRQLMRLV